MTILGDGSALHRANWPRAAALAMLWWVVAIDQFDKFLGSATTTWLLPAVLAMAVATTSPPVRRWVDAQWPRRLTPLLESYGAVLAVFVAVAAFVLLRLVARYHLVGIVHDRGEVLDRGATVLLAGGDPYAALAQFGHFPVELPGAFILAAPFHLLGTAALQYPFWLGLFLVRLFAWIPDKRYAALRAAALLINPGLMRAFGAGNDYAFDAIVIVLALDAAYEAYRPGRSIVAKLAAILLCGVALSIHPVFWVILPVIILAVGEQAGPSGDRVFAVAVVAVVIAICAPFYFADPDHFGPVALIAEFLSMPAGYWLLPIVATACPFFVLPAVPRRNSFMVAGGLAIGIVILPPLLADFAATGFGSQGILALPILLFVMAGWLPAASSIAATPSSSNRTAIHTGRQVHP